jgi:hypothetical protein
MYNDSPHPAASNVKKKLSNAKKFDTAKRECRSVDPAECSLSAVDVFDGHQAALIRASYVCLRSLGMRVFFARSPTCGMNYSLGNLQPAGRRRRRHVAHFTTSVAAAKGSIASTPTRRSANAHTHTRARARRLKAKYSIIPLRRAVSTLFNMFQLFIPLQTLRLLMQKRRQRMSVSSQVPSAIRCTAARCIRYDTLRLKRLTARQRILLICFARGFGSWRHLLKSIRVDNRRS